MKNIFTLALLMVAVMAVHAELHRKEDMSSPYEWAKWKTMKV